MTDEVVDAYLARIGAARPARPTADALADLQERHVLSVPYENIDFHLRRPQRIGAGALDKIVNRRRGGTCFELNGALAEVLRALGFAVDVLAARMSDDGVLGPVLGHMVLRVGTADASGPWLVDVGYGRGSRRPLALTSRQPQRDPQGTFLLAEAPLGDLDLFRDGTRQYRMETRPRLIDDFEHMWWWYCNAADAPTITQLYCTLPTRAGRVTLYGDRLVLRENGTRTTIVYDGDEELREAYRTWFGLELDDLPRSPGR
ncbi:arylamine N-acetyltransferase [Nonomuraea sp. MG754425]|nr:arylamine N-acetyltransferase [Nonomuraea sp. MG754425]